MFLSFSSNHLRHHIQTKPITLFFSRAFTNYHHFLSTETQPHSCAHSDPNHLLTQLQHHHDSDPTTSYTLNRLISTCAKSASHYLGQQAHSITFKLGFDSNVFIATALIHMYCKCTNLHSAQQLFEEMPERNVVTWNSLISGYTHARVFNMAIGLFIQMIDLGCTPTPFTVSGILVSCSQFDAGELGVQVHCLSLKYGYSLNVVVGTALVHMYSKCSNINDSRKCFDQMPERNVITWSSMVSGYAQNRQPKEAMFFVREMRHLGTRLNKVTYNSLLSSFSQPKDLVHGKQVHCQVIIEGLEGDDYIVVTLLTMYAECECLDDFYKISSKVLSRDQIFWNSIIYGFSHLGNGVEALHCFIKMRQACVDVDDFSLTNVLKGIGISSALEAGKQTHGLVLKTGYALNVYVDNALVSMYSRCGAIQDSVRIFLSIDEPDLVSWNSVLSGCAQHGYGEMVIDLFESMRRTGIKPDHTTFLTVLSACSHVGLLDKGLQYFALMRDDLMVLPRVEHYACVVDLLGRAGYLNEAESFINSMPVKPGLSVYKALLSACRVHGDVDIAIRSAKRLLELWPDDPASYVLLSSVLAEGGYWDDAAGLRKLMCEKGLAKKPGYSWIGVQESGSVAIMETEAVTNQAIE